LLDTKNKNPFGIWMDIHIIKEYLKRVDYLENFIFIMLKVRLFHKFFGEDKLQFESREKISKE
jgi:hypothetical protein